MSVSIRRARPEDVEFLVELFGHDEVAPYLAAIRPTTREEIVELVFTSQHEPETFGLFVIEADGQRAGSLQFECVNRRSRIASLGGLAVHPDHRGQRVGDEASRLFQQHLFSELGYHRLQLEVYGFNQRAQRQAERAGFVREGVRRRAYFREGDWVDGVLFGLLAEDAERRGTAPFACRHVTVHVSALEPAFEFYVGVLDLELLERGDTFFAARAGGVRVSVFAGFERAPGERARETGVTLILATDDVDEAFRLVRERGVEPLGDIAEAGGFLRFFSVLDPDGTLVSIAQYQVDDLLEPQP